MTPSLTMEEHMQHWSNAWILLLDIRCCALEEQPLDYTMPANGFMYCSTPGTTITIGDRSYPEGGDWLLHARLGTRVQISPGPSTDQNAGYSLLLYQATFPAAAPDVHRQLGCNAAVRITGRLSLIQQLRTLADVWDADSASAQLQAKSGFLSLIHEWVKLQHLPNPRSNQERIKQMIQYMRKHFTQPFTLAQLAEQASYSVQHFSALFKEVTEQTPIDYLIRLRIEAAKQLLDAGNLSLPQLAELVGYKDPYYFGRLFKRFVGQSPMQYKRASERQRTMIHTPPPAAPQVSFSSRNISRRSEQSVIHPLGETTLNALPRRIVAMCWTSAEYLLALGIVPIGVAELAGMHKWVHLPTGIPARITDTGPRIQPNLESIAALRPDLIVGTKMLVEPFYEQLSQIAPTITYDLFPAPAGCPEYACLESSFLHLATVLGHESLAQAVHHYLEEMYGAMRRRLQQAELKTRKCVLAFGYLNRTKPSMRFSTDGSLVIGIMERLGLANAYKPGHYEHIGFTIGGLEQVSQIEDAHLLHIAPQDDMSKPAWKRLGSPSHASIWPYGGPLSAHMLALSATNALLAAAE